MSERSVVLRRKRKLGKLRVAVDREQVDGHWMREVYVAWRGRGFYVGWSEGRIGG